MFDHYDMDYIANTIMYRFRIVLNHVIYETNRIILEKYSDPQQKLFMYIFVYFDILLPVCS